jgi:7-carboxy-7-deazaguanine synthase
VRVTEIFYSVQGESTWAGRPCVFVRFTGCDLRCGYCDTTYSFHGGQTLSQDEILAEIARHPARYVCLTGGEPLLQRDLPAFAERLLSAGYDVSVETHGQQPMERLPAGVRRIVDLKTPGSGEVHRDFALFGCLGPQDELKVVVTSEDDFRWAVDRIREHGLDRRVGTVLFSPAHGQVAPRALAEWLLASGLEARLQLQLHKLVWGADARGV